MNEILKPTFMNTFITRKNTASILEFPSGAPIVKAFTAIHHSPIKQIKANEIAFVSFAGIFFPYLIWIAICSNCTNCVFLLLRNITKTEIQFTLLRERYGLIRGISTVPGVEDVNYFDDYSCIQYMQNNDVTQLEFRSKKI